jgi:hypothetical protein
LVDTHLVLVAEQGGQMKKNLREAVRVAREAGVKHAHIECGEPHDRLVGNLDGRIFEMVVSRNEKWIDGLRMNVRREISRMRAAIAPSQEIGS